MKVGFFTRLGAYVIDMFIIMVIVSLIGMCLPERNTNLVEEMSGLLEKEMNGEIEFEEFEKEYSNLFYEVQKETVLELGINLAITIVYFVVFQYMNKGQTIGKKLLHIRVVDKETKEPASIPQGMLRSLLPIRTLSGALGIILLYVLDKTKYLNAYSTISTIESTLILLTIIFILYREDGSGLHDMLARTVVVRDNE